MPQQSATKKSKTKVNYFLGGNQKLELSDWKKTQNSCTGRCPQQRATNSQHFGLQQSTKFFSDIIFNNIS